MNDAFHVPPRYFLSHSVGCLPKATADTLDADYFGPWRSGTNWSDWMSLLDTYRAGIGGLLGVKAETICPQVNVSSALTKIVHSLPFDPKRPEILLSRQDFPTIGFVLHQAERAGYSLRFVDGDPVDAQVWADAIDERTALVHVTHALSNSSHLLPVEAICAVARRKGAMSVVDIAQSLVAVPTDVAQWDADFVIGTGVKFLCAGPGACFLYVHPNAIMRCKPVDVGWFSHENPFEMDISRFRYADDAMRFFGGTPSPAPLVCANAAMSVWERLDMRRVQARIQNHLDRLCNVVPQASLVSPQRSVARGATLVIDPPNRPALAASFEASDIQHDERTEGFRFSVHAYTSDNDVAALIGALQA